MTNNDMTEFLLVRHGQTDWNLEGRYQGQADTPLNQNGYEQAKNLALKLKNHPVHAVFSSDLSRAFQTGKIIAETIQCPIYTDKRLREINLGEWEGVLFPEIVRKYPDIWEAREKDPVHVCAPGGESVEEVYARVIEAAQEIAKSHPDKLIALVSHGIALASLLSFANNVPLENIFSLIPDNASPIQIQWKNDRNNA